MQCVLTKNIRSNLVCLNTLETEHLFYEICFFCISLDTCRSAHTPSVSLVAAGERHNIVVK